MIGTMPCAAAQLQTLPLEARIAVASQQNLWMPVDATATVYANWGLWVADCPAGCGNAEHYGPHPVTGHVGLLTRTRFRCSRCLAEARARWPKQRRRIEELLAARPSPANRHWYPGEPVEQLEVENVAAGIRQVM